MKYLNIAAYKFISLESVLLIALQKQLKQKAIELHIKGTILLSAEGINLFLAGATAEVNSMMDFLKSIHPFIDLPYKISQSSHIPFKRLMVRIKQEIITMKVSDIQPEQYTAPYIEPTQLKEWYQQNKPMVLLDTRNSFEVDMGTFTNAIDLNIKSFSDFPQSVNDLPEVMKDQPVVTFCTGGIRCEKAAAYLLKQGFTNVWQLRGGILGYFEQCGGEFFSGKCFVFDNRVALDAELNSAV